MVYCFFNKKNQIDTKFLEDEIKLINSLNVKGIACLGLGTEVNKLNFKEKVQIIELISKYKSKNTYLTITISGEKYTDQLKLIKVANANRADWLVFTGKALQARGDLTADQRRIATGANIQVQGLRNEVQQLKEELQSLRNPRQQGRYAYPQNQYGTIPPYQQPIYPPPQQRQGAYPYYPPPPTPYGYQVPPQQYYPVQKPQTQNLSLKSLEKMRERGLISEETYIKKVQELGY